MEGQRPMTRLVARRSKRQQGDAVQQPMEDENLENTEPLTTTDSTPDQNDSRKRSVTSKSSVRHAVRKYQRKVRSEERSNANEEGGAKAGSTESTSEAGSKSRVRGRPVSKTPGKRQAKEKSKTRNSDVKKRKRANVEEGEFYVEAITDKRVSVIRGQVEYLVKWEGYPVEESTWELAQEVDGLEALQVFEDAIKARQNANGNATAVAKVVGQPNAGNGPVAEERRDQQDLGNASVVVLEYDQQNLSDENDDDDDVVVIEDDTEDIEDDSDDDEQLPLRNEHLDPVGHGVNPEPIVDDVGDAPDPMVIANGLGIVKNEHDQQNELPNEDADLTGGNENADVTDQLDQVEEAPFVRVERQTNETPQQPAPILYPGVIDFFRSVLATFIALLLFLIMFAHFYPIYYDRAFGN